MVITEYFGTRFDGIKLYRTYSDIHHYIIQDQTGIEYAEAIDVENSPYTYTESEREIPDESEPEEENKINEEFNPYK